MWNLVMTPALWGERMPLIYLMLWAVGIGVGVSLTGQAYIAGIMSTASRTIRKVKDKRIKAERLELVKKLRAM